jgi:hypothetical protein
VQERNHEPSRYQENRLKHVERFDETAEIANDTLAFQCDRYVEKQKSRVVNVWCSYLIRYGEQRRRVTRVSYLLRALLGFGDQ